MSARDSSSRSIARVVRAAAFCWLVIGGTANAQDDEAPALDLLEYLGSWEESDEDWLLFENEQPETAADEDAAPDETPTELNNES